MDNKLRKKVLASVLSIVMFFSYGGVSATVIYAEEKNQIKSTTVEDSNIEIEGKNSVTRVLANELANTVEEKSEGDRQENCITDITVEGSYATITYNISESEEAEVVVAIYDEVSAKMMASGKSQINVEGEKVEVCITGKMPEFYTVKAYMLDISTHELLCDAYTSTLYTEEMQSLEKSTVEDYDEERVINLDEDNTTNFVVLNDEITIIEEQENNNIMSLQDDGTYKISSATQDVFALKAGEIISYKYLDGNTLVIKIASMTIDGTTVILKEDLETKTEEIFDVVKVEASNDDGFFVDDSELEEGFELVKETEQDSNEENATGQLLTAEKSVNCANTLNRSIWNGEIVDYDETMKKTTEIIKGKKKISGTNITLSANVSLKAKVNVKVYITTSQKYASLVVDYSAKCVASISGIGKTSIKLGELSFSPCTGIVIKFTPTAMFEFSAKLSWTATVKGTIGGAYSSNGGFENKSKNPTFDSEIDFEGSAYFGIKGTLSGYVVSEDILELSLSIEFGIPINASKNKKTEVHTCTACIKGTINAKLDCTFSVKFLSGVAGDSLSTSKNLINKTIKLKDFYFSLDHMKFGLGTCPYQTTTCKKVGDTYIINFNSPTSIVYNGNSIKFDNARVVIGNCVKYGEGLINLGSEFVCDVEGKESYPIETITGDLYLYDGNGNVIFDMLCYFGIERNGAVYCCTNLKLNASEIASYKIVPRLRASSTSLTANASVANAQIETGEKILNVTGDYSNLEKNTQYLLAVVKDSSANDLFVADNLIYMQDAMSDDEGNLSFDYTPLLDDGENIEYLLFKRKTPIMLTEKNVQAEDIIYDGEEHNVILVVKHEGTNLVENIDYIVNGTRNATEIGTYNVRIIGIGDYCGEINKSYSVVCGHTYIDKVLEDKSNEISAPTYTEKGKYYKVCENCGVISQNDIFEVDTLPSIKISSIQIKPDDMSLEVGSQMQFTSIIMPLDATNKELSWESSDTSVATVDANGKLVARSAGTTTITVKAMDGSGVTSQSIVTIKEKMSTNEQPEKDENGKTQESGKEQNNTVKQLPAVESTQNFSGITGTKDMNSKVNVLSRVKEVKVKKRTKKTVKLSWKRVSGAKGYQIQYALNKKFKKCKKVKTAKTKYIIRKLKKKKTYYIRVRAYRLDGKKKRYGKWSKVKNVKIK